jgi:hypothetical protein
VARLPVGAWVYGMAPLLSSSAASSAADNNADGDDGGERLLLGCSGGAYPDVQARLLWQWGAIICAQQAAAARVDELRAACMRHHTQVLLRIVQLPASQVSREDMKQVSQYAAAGDAPELKAASLPGHRRGVHAVCVRAGRGASASKDSLRLWDLQQADSRADAAARQLCCVTSPAVGAEVACLELLAAAGGGMMTVLCGDRAGCVRGFDAETGACTLSIATGDGAAGALCLLGGDTLAVGSATRARVYDLRAERSRLTAAAAWTAAAASRGVVTLHRAHGGLPVNAMCLPSSGSDGNEVQADANGSGGCGCLLTAGGDGHVTLWDARSWEALQHYAAEGSHAGVNCVAADDVHVAAGYADGRAAAWRL